MSAGGSFNPSGGPINNQQGLQTSPNPSLPPADYSMGYARNSQSPSFFNPFAGYYGANTGMGGFQSQFGGFQQPQFGGFGGFGGFQQPQYGGFQQPQYGGFQQPQYGGFQQQQFGGFGGGFQQPQQFQQPFDGGYGGGFQQPFGGGFGRQSNRFTRRGQEYTQPYNPPQPNQPDYGNMNQFNQPQPQPMPQPPPPQQPMPPPQPRSAPMLGNPYVDAKLARRLQTVPEGSGEYYAIKKAQAERGGYSHEYPMNMNASDTFTMNNFDLSEELYEPPQRQMPQQGGSLLSSLTSTGRPTNSDSGYKYNPNETDEERRIRVNNMTYGGTQFGGGDKPPPGFQPMLGGYGGNFGGFNPMMGGLGGFGGFQQRGTVDQNMNNPAFKQQQDAYNMTDYQRLMQRKDSAANAPPAPPMSGLVGLGGMPIRAPSDYEIAGSLGFKDPNAGRDMLTWVLSDEDYKKRDIQKQSDAKKYLDSVGYGQSGFDPSKYEVKREVQPFSGIGSLFSGLGRG